MDSEMAHGHSPPLPAIAVGGRAYSHSLKVHGTIRWIDEFFAGMQPDGMKVTIATAKENLVPTE